jgi:SAM-dependent methyltransferase
MCDHLLIENPKRRPPIAGGRDEWFPYYAGFSSLFARKIIESSGLGQESTALDPWNGSGTSTAAAAISGYRAIGFDLNPVMAVVAKARVLPSIEMPSVAPLLSEILRKAANHSACSDEDPLLTWFTPSAAAGIRSIERATHVLLVSVDQTQNPVDSASRMSSIASFFYVALFRTVRGLLGRFKASNPTWVTRPASLRSRVRPSATEIRSAFKSHVRAMSATIAAEPLELHSANADCTIEVASSENLPIPAKSVDLVLSSPPYCTRIDYGVATSPELAALGLKLENQLRELRGKLIGTPTIQGSSHAPDPNWGTTCNAFLDRVAQHPSKAAKSYYYKTYIQYFTSIARSISEIGRCVKRGGNCIIVVQDSYFKGIRADLAMMFTEIASANGLSLSRKVDFPMSRTFAHINTKSRLYRAGSTSVESVLCFTKN